MRKLLNVILFCFIILVFTQNCKKLPTACFDYSSNSFENCGYAVAGEEILFSGCSTDATTYTWDFDDDSTSTQVNPTHVFKKVGTYIVSLSSINSDGKANISKEIEVFGTLTGNWSGILNLGTIPVQLSMRFDQNCDEITGSCHSPEEQVFGNSFPVKMNGNVITFCLKLNESSVTFDFCLSGVVNENYDYMEGDEIVNGTSVRIWSATKQ